MTTSNPIILIEDESADISAPQTDIPPLPDFDLNAYIADFNDRVIDAYN